MLKLSWDVKNKVEMLRFSRTVKNIVKMSRLSQNVKIKSKYQDNFFSPENLMYSEPSLYHGLTVSHFFFVGRCPTKVSQSSITPRLWQLIQANDTSPRLVWRRHGKLVEIRRYAASRYKSPSNSRNSKHALNWCNTALPHQQPTCWAEEDYHTSTATLNDPLSPGSKARQKAPICRCSRAASNLPSLKLSQCHMVARRWIVHQT